jgi:hypothetical protein
LFKAKGDEYFRATNGIVREISNNVPVNAELQHVRFEKKLESNYSN